MVIVGTVDISWSCPPSSVLQRYQDKGKPQLYSRRAIAGSGRTEVQNGVWSMEYGAYGGRRGEGDTHRGQSGHGSSGREWPKKYELIKRTFGVVASGKSPWSPHLRYGVRCPDLFGVHFFLFFHFHFFLRCSFGILPPSPPTRHPAI
jgi:hypothetical protein